jgi:hypothetical protein
MFSHSSIFPFEQKILNALFEEYLSLFRNTVSLSCFLEQISFWLINILHKTSLDLRKVVKVNAWLAAL